MTKKDYVLIADCLGEVYFKIRPNSTPEAVFTTIVGVLRYELLKENPRFNADKFEEEIYKQKNNKFAQGGAV